MGSTHLNEMSNLHHQQFTLGEYFAEATLIVPDDVPFNLKVQFSVVTQACQVLILTRFDYAQIKLVYKELCKEIESDIAPPLHMIYEMLDVDRDRFESEFIGDDDENQAHHGIVPQAPKRDGGKKPKRKKRAARGR